MELALMSPATSYVLPGLGAAMAILAMGLFHRSVSQALRSFLLGPYQILHDAAQGCRDASSRFREAYASFRRQLGMTETHVFVQRLFGALLYTLLLAVFLVNDLHLASLWFEGRGVVTNEFPVPVALGTLVSGGVFAATILCGAVLFDLLGQTHLAPYHSSRGLTRVVYGIVVVCALLAVAVTGLMAYDRGVMLVDHDAGAVQTGTSDGVIDVNKLSAASIAADVAGKNDGLAVAVISGHGLLMFLSTGLALWGLVSLFSFIWLAVLRLAEGALWMVALPFVALQRLWGALAEVMLRIAEFALRCCVFVARPIGRWLSSSVCDTERPVEILPQAAAQDASADYTAPEPVREQGMAHGPDAGPGGTRPEGSDEAPALDLAAEDCAKSRNWSPYHTHPR